MYSKETQKLKQDFEGAKERLYQLQADLSEAASQDDEIIQNSLSKASGAAVENPIFAAAKRLIGGEKSTAVKLVPPSATRQELSDRITVLREAIRMQDALVNESRAFFSASLGRDLKPVHHGKIGTIAKAAIALVHAVNGERQFRLNLDRTEDYNQGHTFGNSLQFNLLDIESLDLTKSDSMLNYWIRDVVGAGVITKKEIDRLIKAE